MKDFWCSPCSVARYVQLLSKSGLSGLALTSNDIQEALPKSLSYGLMTADAAHLAVTERRKVSHMASDDSDFEMVPGITLWSP